MFYFYRSRMKSRIKLFAFLLFLVLFGGGAAFFKSRPAPAEKEALYTGRISSLPPENKDERLIIGPGIMRTEYFYSCGHSEYKEEKIPGDYIGLTVDELKEKNPGRTACSYKNGILEIKENLSVKCPDHYSVFLEGGNIVVIRENSPTKTREEIPVDLRGLYKEEIEALEKGLEFSSREEVLEFLEDFSS